MTEEKPVTIELTSKKWKAWQATGLVWLLLGLGVMATDLPFVGEAWVVCGLGFLIYGSVGAWWHHS